MIKLNTGITEVIVRMTVELTEEQDADLLNKFMEGGEVTIPGCKYPMLMTSLDRFARVPGHMEGPEGYRLMANVRGIIVDSELLAHLAGDEVLTPYPTRA